MSSNNSVVSAASATNGSIPSVYDGHSAALLTQHRKERVITAFVEPTLSCTIILVSRYDTDASARSESDTGLMFLETDVRAHANPTRMHVIRQAAEDRAAVGARGDGGNS